MATGDVSSVTVRADGWSADVVITGFTTGATYSFGMGANNDPATAKVVFTVTSLGFDASGNPTTVTRTVYGVPDNNLGAVRKVYPNQTSPDETGGGNLSFRMALSDTIYAKDKTGVGNSGTAPTVTIAAAFVTNTGGASQTSNAVTNLAVTNNSTVAYPKVTGHFAIEQRRPVNGTQTVEVFVSHKYARNGKPVARVAVTAVGATSSHSETGAATAMVASARGDLIPVYPVALSLSTAAGYTRGEAVNINFVAYPWVGDTAATLDSSRDAVSTIAGTVTGSFVYGEVLTQATSGATVISDGPQSAAPIAVTNVTGSPDATHTWTGTGGGTIASPGLPTQRIFALGPLVWAIMDKMIAVVDGVGGGTPTASASQATADANPFSTIALALAGIKTANNSAFSLNVADGGEVQLKAASYSTPTGSTTTNGYVTVRPHSSTNRAGVVFNNTSASNQPSFLRFYNVTFTRPGTGFMVFSANTNYLVMESVNFADAQASAWYSGDINTAIDFLDCVSNNNYFTRGGNDGHARLIRNHPYTATTESTSPAAGNASCILGFKGSGGSTGIWKALASAGFANFVFGYCTQYALTDGIGFDGTISPVNNVAFVCNLFERIGASADTLVEISDNDTVNVQFFNNIFAGQRVNAENDITAPYVNKTFVNWSGRFNSFNARGDHRADIRDTDATMIGTWSVGYSVGWSDNHNEALSYAGDTDFYGIRSNFTAASTTITPSVPAGYVNDASGGGTGLGNGDYHPASGSVLRRRIPAGEAAFPFDLAGNAFDNTGLGTAGAYQYAADVVSGAKSRRGPGRRAGSRMAMVG